MRSLCVALVALAACRAKEAPPHEARVDIVATSTASEWKIARAGSAIASKDDRVWIFIEPSLDQDARRLPGVAFGDAKGPRFGLLSGYFAPLIETHAGDASVVLSGDRARIRMQDAVIVASRDAGRVRVTVDGSAVLLPIADRTEVRASLDGKPVKDFIVVAGESALHETLRIDRLEIRNERAGSMFLDTRCPLVATPANRGSTSVFAIILGTNPMRDPLLGIDDARANDCPRSATSTLTLTIP